MLGCLNWPTAMAVPSSVSPGTCHLESCLGVRCGGGYQDIEVSWVAGLLAPNFSRGISHICLTSTSNNIPQQGKK